MADIHIEREHQLGLAEARRLAVRWTTEAEKHLGVECTRVEGDDADTVEFARSGVAGTFRVDAERFTLDAKLGMLLRPFESRIKSEIETRLNALIGEESGAAIGERPSS